MTDRGGEEEDTQLCLADEQDDDSEAHDVDSVIERAGGCGVFQWRLVAWMALAYAMNAFVNYQQLFVERDLEVVCTGSTAVFIADTTALSIVGEWSLACGRETLKSVTESLFFAGVGVGALSSGAIADAKGRRYAFLLSAMVQSTGACSFIAPNIWVYMVFRLVAGLGVGGQLVVPFVLSMEYVSVSWRGMTGGGMNSAYSVWGTALVPIAFFADSIRDSPQPGDIFGGWRLLSFMLAIPTILFCIVSFFVVPESPRFLVSHSRIDKAMVLLNKVATINGKQLGSVSLSDSDTVEETASWRQLFSRARVLRVPVWRVTVALFLTWFATSFTYYGMSFYAGSLGGDFYINLLVTLAIDIPSYLLSGFLMDRLGRKRVLAGSMFGAAILCIVFVVLQSLNHCEGEPSSCPASPIQRVVSFVGKFFIGVVFAGIYVYTAEVFPTSVRSVGMGTTNFAARVGGVLAPFGVQLKGVSPLIPMLLFASVCSVSAAALLAVPETNKQPLQQTL